MRATKSTPGMPGQRNIYLVHVRRHFTAQNPNHQFSTVAGLHKVDTELGLVVNGIPFNSSFHPLQTLTYSSKMGILQLLTVYCALILSSNNNNAASPTFFRNNNNKNTDNVFSRFFLNP
jgi:hypothetical protein